jgi:hypothetical protein
MPEPTSDAWTQIRYDYEHSDRLIADICAEHGISPNTLRDRVRRWRWAPRRAPIPREGPPAMARIVPTPQQDIQAPSPWPLGPRLLGETRSALSHGDERREMTQPEWGDLPASESHPTPPAFALRASAGDPPPPGEGESAALPRATSEPMTPEPDTDPASIAPRLQSAVARVLPAIETVVARLAAEPLRPREMEQTARALGTLTRSLRELNALLSQHPLRGSAYDDDLPEDIDAFRDALARRIRAFVASRRGEAGAEPAGS